MYKLKKHSYNENREESKSNPRKHSKLDSVINAIVEMQFENSNASK